ncbi:hypothetical protein DUI87_35236 [Hirundo rustica rustica]|uniref:ribonuclease H n=1 Tax=Hirundo rustica rustica TaxID=333673 RepID=A0A3M0IN34_HIRRU|nr:hypothetical protein DUI87_35236 [Hirundo rustica rustica]
MRPVFDKSKGSHAVGSSSTPGGRSPRQVTIRPKDRGRFWGEVKAKVEGLSDGADAGARLAVSDVQPVPSRVPASDPVGPTGQDMAGAAASSEGLQAFPVLQGATHNTYQPLAWQALTELRGAVGKYGLGSAEVMQVLRSFNASLLTPFDIQSLAWANFPPVEYDFFENKWTQLAGRTLEWNRTLGPGDPRRMVNTDMLMGTGNYTRAEGQAGYEPLVQEQCQQTGMVALVQTLQLATPQQPFATIVQGVDEPFLCFAGRLTAAVEKQVSDPAARKLMIQSVAQGNCNAACKRIIETLPGEPSMLDMVGACAKEQLDQGHLEPSTSPWNTPVFCIKKKSGKWRLLQDLRKINAVMEGMGTLQAGMPSPTMLPADWPVLIVDLKDCFFTIPLHPDDRPKFAFTVPTINNAEPAQRYQWRVLPQGMRNSPMLCQWYVARALSGVRKQFPDAHVYHYMDDILVATPTQEELLRLQPQLLNALHSHGLQVAPEKVQQQPPWKYLGVKILERTIRHQEVQFVQSVKTLNDAQKLVGVITWLRPYLGLTTAQLSPLFELLKGDTDLKSPRELTPEARKVLEEVQQAVLACQVYRIEPSIDVTVFITTPDLHPTGVNPRGLKALELWQTDVTQVAEFGRLKYVHVTVDTFSSAMWASAHTGEKARDVIAHWRQAFAVLGIPSAVKTDNGPAYASQQVRQFLQSWGVSHNFGIPHSPTGQAIVERNHGTLKRVLQKQKRGMQGETPHSRLAKALYTINHLTVPQNSNNPVILNHHLSLQASDGEQQPRAKVRVRNLVTKQWEGPYDLISMGRGYACVSTDTGTRWLPSKCVRPDLRPQRQNSADRQGGSRDQLESHQVDESSSDHSDDSSTDSD